MRETRAGRDGRPGRAARAAHGGLRQPARFRSGGAKKMPPTCSPPSSCCSSARTSRAGGDRDGGVLGTERAGLERQRVRLARLAGSPALFQLSLHRAMAARPKSFEFLVKAEEREKADPPRTTRPALQPRIPPVSQGVRPADHAVCGSGSAGGDPIPAVAGSWKVRNDATTHREQGCRHDIVCASCVAGAGLGLGDIGRPSRRLPRRPRNSTRRGANTLTSRPRA